VADGVEEVGAECGEEEAAEEGEELVLVEFAEGGVVGLCLPLLSYGGCRLGVLCGTRIPIVFFTTGVIDDCAVVIFSPLLP
jgi:hypothetical protein